MAVNVVRYRHRGAVQWGVVEPGAYADILLWDENPLEDINVILNEDSLALVMKDGVIYKNTL